MNWGLSLLGWAVHIRRRLGERWETREEFRAEGKPVPMPWVSGCWRRKPETVPCGVAQVSWRIHAQPGWGPPVLSAFPLRGANSAPGLASGEWPWWAGERALGPQSPSRGLSLSTSSLQDEPLFPG